MNFIDTITLTHEGHTFTVDVIQDDDRTPPWDRADGHGPVTDYERRAKRPGEWVLYSDFGRKRFYDAQEAMKLARRDGWGCSEEHVDALRLKLKREPTVGDLAAEAVRLDFEFLRGWCKNDWTYVGVCVRLEGDPEDKRYDHSLWGVESSEEKYIREVAAELADDLLSAELADARKMAQSMEQTAAAMGAQ